MKIKSVKLSNYCQHSDLEVSLDGSLVGIIGENGSGKSNLVGAVDVAITGKFPKTKERMISYGEKKGFLEVEMEDRESGRIVIRRDLNGSGCKLESFDAAGAMRDGFPLATPDSVNSAMGNGGGGSRNPASVFRPPRPSPDAVPTMPLHRAPPRPDTDSRSRRLWTRLRL